MPGSFESWQSYGNWVYRLNKDRDELPPAEQNKIASLIEGATDNKTKAKILYKYLQDYTRDINVSVKLGGFQTYPASYVSENKYGDCKALTYFMQALLKHVGVDSYPALVLAGDGAPKTDASFPYPEFNHVILSVPFSRGTVFLECTDKNIPFGYLGTFTQNRPVLIMDEHNSHISQTPALSEKEVLCTTSFDVNTEHSEVELKCILRGEKYEYFNSMTNKINRNEIDMYIRNGVMPSSSELLSYEIGGKSRDKAQIQLNAKVRVEDVVQEYGNNLRIAPFPMSLPLYETPQKRKSDILLDYPECYSNTVTYHLGQKKLTKVPPKVEVHSKFGSYTIGDEIRTNELVCIKTLSIHAGRVGLNEYNGFYEFIDTQRGGHHLRQLRDTLLQRRRRLGVGGRHSGYDLQHGRADADQNAPRHEEYFRGEDQG